MTAREILGDYEEFVDDLLNRTNELGIDYDNFPIDHVCYRVDSLDEYRKKFNQLSSISSAVAKNEHHGREIAKFKLITPLRVREYEIPVVELPQPKSDKKYNNGLEHLEMVVGADFSNFYRKYQNLWTGTDDSGAYNQPVYITFDNGRSIKFHEYSLLDVLAKEGTSWSQ